MVISKTPQPFLIQLLSLGLLTWIIVTNVLADGSDYDSGQPLKKEHEVFESCSITFMNCSTEGEIDYDELYSCTSGLMIRGFDSCLSGLSCQDEICLPDCSPRESSVYDYVKNKCVTKVGSSCEPWGRDCEANAVCKRNASIRVTSYRSNFICQCKEGFQYINGQCTKIVVYGKNCSTEDGDESQRQSDCDLNASIICLNQTCQCKSSDQVFLAEENRCMAKLNGSCWQDRLDDRSSRSICHPGLLCYHSRSYKCGCGAYTEASENGSGCLGITNYSLCEPQNPYMQCDPELLLECRSGSAYCQCAGGRIFENGACLNYAGSECDPEVAPIKFGKKYGPCVDNAVCIEGKCLCVDGHSESLFGRCSLSFGQPCNYTKNVSGDLATSCNSVHGLSCVDGKCSCKDIHETFNVDKDRCEDSFQTQTESYEDAMNELYTSGSATKYKFYILPAVVVSMIAMQIYSITS